MQSLVQSSIRFFGGLLAMGLLFSPVVLAEVIEDVPVEALGADSLEQYYGQTLDIQVLETPAEQFKGEVRMNKIPLEITSAEFYMVSYPEKVLVLQESYAVDELIAFGDTKLAYEFDIDVSKKGLGGSYDLYVSFTDTFSKRVGVGKKRVNFEQGDLVAPKLSNASIEKSSVDGEGVATFSFSAGSEGFDVSPVVRLYENSLSGSPYGEYKGEPVVTQPGKQKTLSVDFPWPNQPESYVVVIRAEDESGNAHGGEVIERVIVEGEFAEIFGVTPSKGTVLEDVKDIDIFMKGYVPYGKSYDLMIGIEQKDEKRVVSQDEKSLQIQSNKEALFEISESFAIEAKAETVLLKAQIINPDTKQVIEEKEYSWKKAAPVADVSNTDVSAEPVAVERNVDPIRLYVLGAILLILLLLVYLFARNKKHLGVWVILLGSIFFSSAHAQTALTGFTTELSALEAGAAFTTDDTTGGFHTMSVTGRIENNLDSTGAFEYNYLDIKTVTVDFLDAGSNVVTTQDVDGSLILLEEFAQLTGGGALFPTTRNKFTFLLDLSTISNLDEGEYGIRLTFLFQSGDGPEYLLVFPDRSDFLIVDNTEPSLSPISGSDLPGNPLNDSADVLFSCNDLSGCLNIEETGAVVTPQEFDAQIKGNFCDGAGDGNKLCETDAGKQTYEVCDGAGNCSDVVLADLIPSGDLFFYDPFPPKLSNIQIQRDATPWVRGESPVGGNIEANDVFEFELLDDTDAEFEAGATDTVTIGGITYPRGGEDWADWEQGPAGDRDACGETFYNPASASYEDRDYDPVTPGIQKGEFFFEGGKCKQRLVACTKGNGHRGYWDRSVNTGPYQDSFCIGTSDCAAGYVLNDQGDVDPSNDVCERINQCNPLQESTILQDVPNLAWISIGTATEENQSFTYGGATPTTGACEWGCIAGYTEDPNTHRCVPDCKDGLLPLCMGAECFGDTCSTPTPGVCGDAHNTVIGALPTIYTDLCQSGFPTNIVQIGATQWEWDCLGGQGLTPGVGAGDAFCQTSP